MATINLNVNAICIGGIKLKLGRFYFISVFYYWAVLIEETKFYWKQNVHYWCLISFWVLEQFKWWNFSLKYPIKLGLYSLVYCIIIQYCIAFITGWLKNSFLSLYISWWFLSGHILWHSVHQRKPVTVSQIYNFNVYYDFSSTFNPVVMS